MYAKAAVVGMTAAAFPCRKDPYRKGNISDSLKFPDSSHFGESFKRAIGRSPLQHLKVTIKK